MQICSEAGNIRRQCAICGENNKRHVDFHHYYPRPYRRMGNGNDDGEYICQDFHRWLHRNYTNRELATVFNNLAFLNELKELYDMGR